MDLKTQIIENSGTGSSSMFHPFIFNTFDEWKDKPLSFWLDILEDIKNRPLCLYLFLPFAYIFLGINLVEEYFNLKNVSDESLEYVRNSLGEEYHWLFLRESDINMASKINHNILNEAITIKKKLSQQGGKPVDQIFLSKRTPQKVDRDDFLLSQYLISKQS